MLTDTLLVAGCKSKITLCIKVQRCCWMLGPLHIEKNFMDAIGDWMEGSGWCKIYNYSGKTTSRRIESFLTCSGVVGIKRARYTHNPTTKHGQFLLRIGRYLKGTREFGTLLQPSTGSALILQCYSDADFAGLYKVDHKEDPHCVKSRIGYVITLNNCPVSWGSKL